MKKFLFLLSFMMLLFVYAHARTLKIIKLNTSSIRIGNQTCKVGSTFSDEEVPHWSSPKQAMWVKYTDGIDREKKCLTRESFANRKANTPKEYFDKINHPSTRADDIDFAVGKNKSQFTDKRIALVIGNSNYNYQSTLSNPINDATDVAEKLIFLGFDVYLIHDVNYTDFDTSLKKFCGHAQNNNYDVAILYFCGHGIQYQGQSYLIPIDAHLNDASDLYNCIDMEDVYSKMGRTKCSTNLIFIDACRTEKEWNKKEEQQREKDPQNVGVLFSSAPNSVALDGEERNSPFANAFIQSISEPSTDFLSTINRISLRVEQETNKKQEPHYVGKTSFSFTFVEAASSSIQSKEDDLQVIEDALHYAKLYKKGEELYDLNSYDEAIDCFKKVADSNSKDKLAALSKLAFYYYKRDNVLAEQYARRGANLGDESCQLWLGQILYDANKKEEALQWFIKSAEQGQGWAAYLAGQMYENGDGVVADREKAIFWYRKSVSTTNAYAEDAQKALINMGAYINEYNYMSLVENASIKGHLNAEELFQEGQWWSFEKKPEQLAYLIASAEKGYPDAQEELGNIFVSEDAKDLGIYNEDLSKEWTLKAFNKYKKQVEEGDKNSMYCLGKMYQDGNSIVKQNVAMAETYFRMGAELGHELCQLYLGQLLYDNERKKEALQWLEKSAKQGQAKAAFLAGQMYEFGDGVIENLAKAKEFYIIAAKQTHNSFSRNAEEALRRLKRKRP